MNTKVLLEQKYSATKSEFFLTTMEDSHIQHLIKLAHDPSLVDSMGYDIKFGLDDTEKFIDMISSTSCFPDCQEKQSLELFFGFKFCGGGSRLAGHGFYKSWPASIHRHLS